MKNLITLVNQLRSYSSEREWFEFKVNWFEPAAIGEYISAISNSAACTGRKEGYFIWGINNSTHEIEGTSVKKPAGAFPRLPRHMEETHMIFVKTPSWLRFHLSGSM